MAGEKIAPNVELDTMAFEIFSKRVAASPAKRGGEREAMDAYRCAEAFLAARDKVRSGELREKPVDLLADCHAPNLKRTHPHNLVSKAQGNLERVNRIRKWLDSNPTPADEPDQLLARLNREFPDLGWDLPTVNVARAIFPQYAKA